jgi:hypothetical protein
LLMKSFWWSCIIFLCSCSCVRVNTCLSLYTILISVFEFNIWRMLFFTVFGVFCKLNVPIHVSNMFKFHFNNIEIGKSINKNTKIQNNRIYLHTSTLRLMFLDSWLKQDSWRSENKLLTSPWINIESGKWTSWIYNIWHFICSYIVK